MMIKRKKLSEEHKQKISEALIGKLRGKQKNGIYSQSLKDKAVHLYKNGYNTVEIATILKKPHKSTVSDWIKDAGIIIVRKDPRHYKRKIQNKAIELYKLGYGLEEISRKLGIISFGAVANWIRNAKISRSCGVPKGRYGSLANNWKGGVTPENRLIRGSEEYANWRLAVFERDNFTCVSCEKTGGYLHAHHILIFSKYPKMRFVLENGITLCQNCHRKLHKRKVNIA